MFKNLMGNVFPPDWMILNLLQMKVFLRAIDQYSDVLNKYFLDSAHFHLQVSLTRSRKGVLSAQFCFRQDRGYISRNAIVFLVVQTTSASQCCSRNNCSL